MSSRARRHSLRERDGVRLRIVRINVRRQIRESAVRHVAFGAVRGADFHVALHAGGNLDGFTALQFCGDVKTVQRVVNPNSVLIRSAFHGGAVSRERGVSSRSSHQEKEDSESIRHFTSMQIASGVCGSSGVSGGGNEFPKPHV